MSKKSTKYNPKNGHQVIEDMAGKPGVEIHQKKNGMVTIKTDKGSMQVVDGKSNYSEHDKANVRKWLKLIGLLILLGTCGWIYHVISVRAALPM